MEIKFLAAEPFMSATVEAIVVGVIGVQRSYCCYGLLSLMSSSLHRHQVFIDLV